MATTEERLAALEQKMQMLTTPPDDYYMSRWTGEQIDNAVAKINSADGLVTAFNGRSGAVLPQAGDYTAAMVGAASIGEDGKIPESQLPQLTSNVTLYVNASTGNDNNTGTSSKPFATIQAAVNSLPKNFGMNSARINIAAGVYEEDVVISGLFNGININNLTRFMSLWISGSDGTTIKSLQFINCSCPFIFAQNIQISGGVSSAIGNAPQGTGIVVQGCRNIDFNGITMTNCSNGLFVGTYFSSGGSSVFLNNATISGATGTAVACTGQNKIFSLGLGGTGNTIGLAVSYGGEITTVSLTMTATTAQSIYAGFINTF